MEKGTYDQRTEMSDRLTNLVNNIDNFVTKETRPGSVNSEAIANFNEIITLFENGNYIEALVLYDKMQKFSDLNELDKLLVLKAKAYVGQIILWNLTNLGENQNKLIKGDWFNCGFKDLDCKKKLLNEVLNTDIQIFPDKNSRNQFLALQKQAYVAINKYYE